MKGMNPMLVRAVTMLFAVLPLRGDVESMAERLITAHETGELLPLVSSEDAGLKLDAAYRIQRLFVEERSKKERISGYKAGLTTKASQSRFGLGSALSGVLLESMDRTGEQVIELKEFHRLLIETEIAFIVDERIRERVEDTSALKEMVGAVAASLELPDVRFAEGEKLRGIDLAASNVSAAAYVLGEKTGDLTANLSELEVTLTRNGEIVNEGHGSDAFGDPWKVALWLVNSLLAQGWTIEPGHVLLTGALGDIVPAEAGHYEADFGLLGKLSIEIR